MKVLLFELNTKKENNTLVIYIDLKIVIIK